MPFSPPLCLRAYFQNTSSSGNDYTTTLTIEPQTYTASGPTTGTYDGTHVDIGMYATSNFYGQIFRIKSITSQTSTTVVAVLEDINGFNAKIDVDGSGNGAPYTGYGYIFELNSNGLPALTAINTSPTITFPDSILGRFLYDQATGPIGGSSFYVTQSGATGPTGATGAVGDMFLIQNQDKLYQKTSVGAWSQVYDLIQSTGPISNIQDGFTIATAFNGALCVSPDGINWRTIDTSAVPYRGLGYNGSVWLAGGTSSTGKLSTNGTSLIDITITGLSELFGFAWSGTVWVAVGTASGSPISSSISYSFDNVNWTATGHTFANRAYDVAWNGNMFVAVGGDSGFTLATSYDGITWTNRNSDLTAGTAIAWNGTRWLAGGGAATSSGSKLLTSTDGITWTTLNVVESISTGIGLGVADIAWNGYYWVLAGYPINGNAVAYATDAEIAANTINIVSSLNTIFSEVAYSVTWNGSLWIIAGKGSTATIAVSSDVMNWTQVVTPIDNIATQFTMVRSRKLLPLVGQRLYNGVAQPSNISQGKAATGAIMYWDGNYPAGDSNIKYTPSTLTFNSATGPISVTVQNSNIVQLSTGAISVGKDGNASGPSLTWVGDTDTGFWHPASGAIAVSTNGSERLRVDSSGNVGLATGATGAVLLDVNGRARIIVDGSTSTSQWGVNNSTDSLIIQNSGNYSTVGDLNKAGSIFFANRTLNYPQARIASEMSSVTPSGYSSNLIFQTNGGGTSLTERMRIHTNGNIGIGNTAPTNLVDITTATRSGTHPSSLGLYVTRTPGSNIDPIATFSHTNGTQSIGIGWNSIVAAGSNATQDLAFYNKGGVTYFYDSTGPTERMRIETDGRLILGASGAAAAPSLTWLGDTNTGFYKPALDAIAVTTNGTERLRLDAIGTTIFNNTGTATGPTLAWTGDLGTGFWHPAANTLAFSTSSVERLRIGPTGAVGISLPAYLSNVPTTTLHVGGIIKADGSAAGAYFEGLNESQFIGAGVEYPLIRGSNGSGIWLARPSNGNGEIVFKTNASSNTVQTERMRILSNGNVGIGSTGPVFPLDVNGVIRGSSNIIYVANATYNMTSTWNSISATAYTSLASLTYTPKQSGTVKLLIEGTIETYQTSKGGDDGCRFRIFDGTNELAMCQYYTATGTSDWYSDSWFQPMRYIGTVSGALTFSLQYQCYNGGVHNARRGVLTVYEISSTA